MKKNVCGFTIMEVSLFLALSGFLMVGLIASANMSINRQRYSDSVNAVSDYLRGVYSDVLNVSNDKTPSSEDSSSDAGRSGTAIYGKLLVFGEHVENAAGDQIEKDSIHAYDIVGAAATSSNITASNTLDILRAVGANIVYDAGSGASHDWKVYRASKFTAPWEATLENSDGSQYVGMVMIVRSPVSGTIHTYSVTGSAPQVMNRIGAGGTSNGVVTDFNNYLGASTDGTYTGPVFSETQVDICVDSDDLGRNGNRRDVRINAFAANSTGVKMVEQDLFDGDNPSICQGKGN